MTTETITLSSFLSDRIDDDEAAARAAFSAAWALDEIADVWREDADGQPHLVARRLDEHDAAHIARHGPARVLAECAAKRPLVEFWSGWDALCPPDDWPESGDMSSAALADAGRLMLRTLATVYADHPDYREEWRP